MPALIKQRKPRAEEVKSGQLMGLEKAGMVLYPDCTTEFEIPFINNRYQLGLDNEPELKAKFENHFGVKFDTPEGIQFLDDYRIVLNHDIQAWDTRHVEHEFNKHVLKFNKGMGYVAFSQQDLEENGAYPFVVVDEEQEMSQRVMEKSRKVKAMMELGKLEGKPTRLIQIAEYMLDFNGKMTKDFAFDRIHDLIQTVTGSDQFLQVLQLDAEFVDTMITVKKAIGKNIIRMSKDQWYVNHMNQTKLGRNRDEVVKYLMNPQNQDQLGLGKGDDHPYAIKQQLKESIE